MHGQNLFGEATIRTLHCDMWILQTSDQNFEKNKRTVTLFRDKKMIQKYDSSQPLKKFTTTKVCFYDRRSMMVLSELL